MLKKIQPRIMAELGIQISPSARRASNISNDELLAVQGEFAGLDRDGDNLISTDELKQLLYSMRFKLVLTEQQINRLIKQIDTDDNGVVDMNELNEIIEKFDNKGVIYKALSERSKIRTEFLKYDKDNSGFITIDELTHVVSERLGILFSERHIRRIMSDVDDNGDGSIDYEEFCTLMTKSFLRKRVMARSPRNSIRREKE